MGSIARLSRDGDDGSVRACEDKHKLLLVTLGLALIETPGLTQYAHRNPARVMPRS